MIRPIERFLSALIDIALDSTNSAIARGFNFYHRNPNYLKIEKICFPPGQAFANFKLQHFFRRGKLRGLRVLLRTACLVIHKLVKFYMKKLHEKNRDRDIHQLYVLFLVLCTRRHLKQSISLSLDFRDSMAFDLIPRRF